MESQLIEVGDKYAEDVFYTQEQVEQFAVLSGDDNPIHIDPDYASQTVFKKPIVHGILAISVFSKMIGTSFPGEGTVYLNQKLSFRKPVYPGEKYQATIEVIEVNKRRHIATMQTFLIETSTGKPVIKGEAQVMHQTRI
ncbi:MAG: MaoC family dehydratase [Bacteroidota bacterium]